MQTCNVVDIMFTIIYNYNLVLYKAMIMMVRIMAGAKAFREADLQEQGS